MRKNPSVFNALGFFYWGFSSSNIMNNGKFNNIRTWLREVRLKQGILMGIRATVKLLDMASRTLCDCLRIREII
ncbi:hypothetical protein [Photobacterium damselae]|uniref:Uncharacterized protein n=1 Tax=Photobacterium damselae subsp. damselae TaxID=85581 RepID=A0AAD3WU16_PHODD|nr:hypothetical protein [Photobacterium damselae]KAB1178903.1 hypothetical protein F6450_14500 [Photobacterium damselae subsp. damselae]